MQKIFPQTRLHFNVIDGEKFGANAFALPDGTGLLLSTILGNDVSGHIPGLILVSAYGKLARG